MNAEDNLFVFTIVWLERILFNGKSVICMYELNNFWSVCVPFLLQRRAMKLYSAGARKKEELLKNFPSRILLYIKIHQKGRSEIAVYARRLKLCLTTACSLAGVCFRYIKHEFSRGARNKAKAKASAPPRNAHFNSSHVRALFRRVYRENARKIKRYSSPAELPSPCFTSINTQ